jgi:malate dehydrogenase (oxaloacetate-decarboxylating)(NADP+)
MDSGVARKPIVDMDAYRPRSFRRAATRSPARCSGFTNVSASHPKRVVFAEGEEEQVMRAAVSYVNQRLGKPPARTRGTDPRNRETGRYRSRPSRSRTSSTPASRPQRVDAYADYLYARLQRKGYLLRDCQRLVNNDRNYFGACMVARGDADAMVTGTTRNYSTALRHRSAATIDVKPGHRMIGVSLALCRGRTVFVADTAVIDMPNSEELADIAEEAAGMSPASSATSRALPCWPIPPSATRRGERSEKRSSRRSRSSTGAGSTFEYDGEMAADVALNWKVMAAISVLPPVRHRQRAGHAGLPLGLHLDQDAAGTRWRNGHRPASGRSRQVDPDRLRWAPRTATSSTWPPSPPTTHRTEGRGAGRRVLRFRRA